MKYLSGDLRQPVRMVTSDRVSVQRDPAEVVLHDFISRGAVEVIPARAPGESNSELLNRHYFGISSLLLVFANSKISIRLDRRQVEGLVGSYFRARFGRYPCALAKIPERYY